MTKIPFIAFLFIGMLAFTAANAKAADSEAATRQKIVQAILSSGDDQQKILNNLKLTPADSARVAGDLLQAWNQSKVYLYQPPDNTSAKIPVILDDKQNADGKSRAVRVDDGKPLTDGKGAELDFAAADLTQPDTDLDATGVINDVITRLQLEDPDVDTRSTAVQSLGNSQDLTNLPILLAIQPAEKNARVLRTLRIAIATLNMGSTDVPTQIKAVKELGDMHSIGSMDDLKSMGEDPGTPPDVAKACKAALKSIQNYLSVVNFFGTIFRGISTGSILLVVALGLAITFGLMGIINMAHGEMIAIGGYTSYVVQNVFMQGFVSHVNIPFTLMGRSLGFNIVLPGLHAASGSTLFECYFLVVIPLSFLAAALAGLVLERTVIQFLYRRPLESLLATWGVSLIMQQCFRLVFGANNVQIEPPDWLVGHYTFCDIDFEWNRLFVIGFAIIIVIGTWMLLTKTPLGLLIRAVMQNRDMAACMGVPTKRVYMLTFAFGSGLAGLAGAFLSQITNVGPTMGQSWIVDSFMTVVVGGVGNILGTIYAALGYGTADQVLQQVFGSPVIGRITVMIAIILFLQWKPGGLFPTRSRSLEG